MTSNFFLVKLNYRQFDLNSPKTIRLQDNSTPFLKELPSENIVTFFSYKQLEYAFSLIFTNFCYLYLICLPYSRYKSKCTPDMYNTFCSVLNVYCLRLNKILNDTRLERNIGLLILYDHSRSHCFNYKYLSNYCCFITRHRYTEAANRVERVKTLPEKVRYLIV